MLPENKEGNRKMISINPKFFDICPKCGHWYVTIEEIEK